MENSYGKFFIDGRILPTWYRLPRLLSYYFYGGGGSFMDELVTDALIQADADVDYSRYDNDGDGVVDGVIIIYPGHGYEEVGGDVYTHQGWVFSAPAMDGVTFYEYTFNPEEYGDGLSNMGIFCHEYAHALGAPDMYDVDHEPPGSEGLGNWSMMAMGMWAGDSRRAVGFDPYCKILLGFVQPTEITGNLRSVAFPRVEDNPIIYKLNPTPGVPAREYWLVENRQKVGCDALLPSRGLLIYHVDTTYTWGNYDHTRYLCGLEQADGHNHLALGGNYGDDSDPWPGTTGKRAFHDLTTPNSRTNVDELTTQVGVWNITDSDSLMFADLDIRYSRPLVQLVQSEDSMTFIETQGSSDGDSLFEAGESIDFYVKFTSRLRNCYNWYVELASASPHVQFVANDVKQNSLVVNNGSVINGTAPVRMTIGAGQTSDIVGFTVYLRIDTLPSGGGYGDRGIIDTFYCETSLGIPRVLVVDDDNGGLEGAEYKALFSRHRVSFRQWEKLSKGTPSGATLQVFPSVVWLTGHPTTGGNISSNDVAVLKQYLDAGGSLAITSFSAGRQIAAVDPSFLTDYLKCTWTDVTDKVPFMRGHNDNPLGKQSRVRLEGLTPGWIDGLIDPLEGGSAAYYVTNSSGTANYGNAGVTYAGSYRSVFLGFPLEYVGDDYVPTYLTTDSLFDRLLWFLDEFVPRPRYAGITANDSLHVLDHIPLFWWTYDNRRPGEQDQVEFEVGTDTDWGLAEQWTPGVLVSVDTTLVYGGSALVDGARYHYRVRTHDGEGWSEWSEYSFRMNSLPPVPVPSSPVDSALVPDQVTVQFPAVTDAEADQVGYDVELYADESLTQLVTSVSDHWPGAFGTILWSPSPQPPKEHLYFWRARSYDRREHSAWSEPEKFYLFDQPNAPSSFALIAPVGLTPTVDDLTPTFRWHRSVDADAGDVVRYRWELSRYSNFSVVTRIDSLLDTTWTPSTALLTATRYHWRVTAFDQTGLSAVSSTAQFQTWRPGDVNADGSVDLSDMQMVVDYLFFGGTPTDSDLADVNGDCVADLSDLQAIIDYIFFGGTFNGLRCPH